MDPISAPPAMMALLGAVAAAGVCGLTFTWILHRRDAAARRQRAAEERRLLDFAEVSSDWFWEMDEGLRFTRFSGHILEALGIDGSVYIGRTRREISADAGTDEHWRAHLDAMDRHEPFHDFRYDLQLPDGRTLFISISGRPVIDDAGRFHGYRGTGRDLTAEVAMRSALGASEQRFQAVVENVPWAIYIKDTEGRLVWGNQMYMDWLGTDLEHLSEFDFADHFPADIQVAINALDKTPSRAAA